MTNHTVHTIRTQFLLWLASWAVLVIDLAASAIAFWLVFLPVFARLEFTGLYSLQIYCAMSLLWGSIMFLANLYSGEATTSRIGEIQKWIKISFTVVVLAVFIDALFPLKYAIHASAIIKYWLIFALISLPLRFGFRTMQKALLRRGIGQRRTLIMGVNQRGIRAEQEILDHDQQGFDVVGFVRSNDDPVFTPPSGLNIIGAENEIRNLILQNQVSDVVLALEKPEHERVMSAINNINGTPVSIRIVPDLYEVISGLARTGQLYGLPLLDINLNITTFYNRIFKRMLDLVIATAGFIVTSPVWLLVAAAIKIDTRGPILYSQMRVGLNNREFKIFKFRSMIDNAEAMTGPVWAREADQRITSVGRLLRRFRLDEIPQLLNIMKGDMSLVGPRPERPYFVDQLINEYPFYHRRHRVRPGLSGWAQIKRPYDSDLEDVRQKLKYDFFYIESLSFSLDLTIILNTIWVVLSGKGR